MPFIYSVLGAGKQGSAITYDLVKHGDAEQVVICDSDLKRAEIVAQRTNIATGKTVAKARQCDATSAQAIREVVRGSRVVVSALPYHLNFVAAQAAIAETAHFCDLGGNTEVVLQELELDPQAKETGVSILPDCGLAPGLSNLLSARAIFKMKRPHSIKVRCGGIPRIPRPPFFYKFVFNLEGLVNEYSGEATVLRNGKIARIPALTELETLEVPGIGTLEAFVTTGGTSTAPFSFQGRVDNFDYKTLRHPGHYSAMKAFSDLGLFETKQMQLGANSVSPRSLFLELLGPKINFTEDRDFVVLNVEAMGEMDGKQQTYRAVLVDEGDPLGHFTAMERTTAFPTAAIAHLQATDRIAPGAVPIEKSVPLDEFFKAIEKRGLKIQESMS